MRIIFPKIEPQTGLSGIKMAQLLVDFSEEVHRGGVAEIQRFFLHPAVLGLDIQSTLLPHRRRFVVLFAAVKQVEPWTAHFLIAQLATKVINFSFWVTTIHEIALDERERRGVTPIDPRQTGTKIHLSKLLLDFSNFGALFIFVAFGNK